MTPLLEIGDLNVHIGGSHLVQGLTMTVPATGVTALLGRNGAGKTTTLRALLGLVPRTGSVRLAGEEIARLPTYRIVRLGVGYVPEDRGVFAGLTVAENLRLAERGAPRYDLVYELFPELRKRGGQRAGSLSGGQQQMLAIGRCLLVENRILLIDEPTKGLAPKIVTEVAQVLERVAQAVPILLVEQNLPLVARLAGPVAVLEQGRIVHNGTADELLADPERTRAFLGVGTSA
jgi:branched-chain amino acid transport system ATP-binding protein